MTVQNFGLIRQGAGSAILKSIPIPQLQDDYILVRVVCIALNPTDWTTLEAPGADGTLVGCDYSGIVEAVGPSVARDFRPGDRVAGFGHGGNDANPATGAFARYIAVKGDLQMRIPAGVSFEAACTVGVGVASAGYALYKVLNLDLPGDVDAVKRPAVEPILIYGGSTATGSLAIQFAKLSGRKVITTCSPKHFELARSRGADEVFDYRDPDVANKISIAADDNLRLVFDTVGLESSHAIACKAISATGGGQICTLLPIDESPRTDVTTTFFLGYSISGEAYIFEGESYEAQSADFAFAKRFMPVAEQLWAEGKLEPHPRRVGEGGLQGAVEGMREMKEGRVSGFKLVYRVDDTVWPGQESSTAEGVHESLH